MSKLLWVAVGIIALTTIFVLGWGYGEKSSVSTLSFNTQSVKVNETSAQRKTSANGKLDLVVFPEDKESEALGSDPMTKEVKCPGADSQLYLSVPSHTEIKMLDADGNEVSTHGFQLSMIAQESKEKVKLMKAILPTNPFALHKCLYVTNDNKLVMLSIKLSSEFNTLNESGNGFIKQ